MLKFNIAEIGTINGTKAVSNTAKHLCMSAYSLWTIFKKVFILHENIPNFKESTFVTFLISLGRGSNNQNGNLRWFLPLGVRPTPPYWHKFPDIFYPTFFLLQLNPTYLQRILHFKNITFKSSYNWFKIDIHQQLRPLTANYSAMFKVISTTIYT